MSLRKDTTPFEDLAERLDQIERDRREPDKVLCGLLSARRALREAEDDEDSAGAELSRMECDLMYIHDALTDAGLEGAINAESIIERIEILAAERSRA